MAKKPQNASLVSLASTFTRTNGQPIDNSILHNSLTDAENYAKKDVAYVGQLITVVEEGAVNNYSIVEESGKLRKLAYIDSILGNKTYENIEQVNYSELYQGQIITVVSGVAEDMIDAKAYIVVKTSEDTGVLIQIGSSLDPLPSQVITDADIEAILAGDYTYNESLNSKYSMTTSTVEEIVDNRYVSDYASPELAIKESTIDDIVY